MKDQANNDEAKTAQVIKRILKLGSSNKELQVKITKPNSQINFAIYTKDQKIMIHFGQPVLWIGMDPNQAIDLGNQLLKQARRAQRPGK